MPRPVCVAMVLTLALAAATPPLGATEHKERREPSVLRAHQGELRAKTPNTVRAAIETLGRIRLHPGRDALEVGETSAGHERGRTD